MRVLITQRELIHRRGSEMFTVELAKALRGRGYEVVVFCPRVGELAQIIYPCGAEVKTRLADVPWVPDIVHGQHHLQTMAALSYFTLAPAIYYCHGWIPWVEQVPLHPRIRHYVMMCEWLVSPTAAALGIPKSQITVVPNFINAKRFSEVRRPPDRPTRALLFGKGGFSVDELTRLEQACSEAGMSLDKIGYPYKNPQERPEAFLQDYDLVFAIGRCAIEAIACGCAVIPIVPKLAGELVTPENYDAWAFSNFSPVYGNSAVQSQSEWLKKELSKYSPDSILRVTARLRSERDASSSIDKLAKVYTSALDEHRINKTEAAREFAPYLEKLSFEVDGIWERSRRVEKQAKEIERLKQELRSIKRLKPELRSIKQLNKELRSIQSSAMWRLAKSFRRVRSLFQSVPRNGRRISAALLSHSLQSPLEKSPGLVGASTRTAQAVDNNDQT
jgi:hypothetical protein